LQIDEDVTIGENNSYTRREMTLIDAKGITDSKITICFWNQKCQLLEDINTGLFLKVENVITNNFKSRKTLNSTVLTTIEVRLNIQS
jgi:hypothetical protein